jgi:thiamine pyrophosphate-dependent acetolactate synthase large subunit-like protein
VADREELTEALRTAIGSGGPELVEVQVTPGMALV